jgi:hypothetical protein
MEAEHILQDRPLASEETLDMDDPVVQFNLRNLLEKCTQEDSSTWRAVSFLLNPRGTEYKDSNFPFDRTVKVLPLPHYG